MEKQSKGIDLQWKILIGIVAGIGIGMGINMAMGAGITSGPLYVMKTVFQYGGDIFIRLLRMLIVPLVFASIFMAVANLGDVRALGKIGGKTVGYYMLTTALAVLAGLIVVNMIPKNAAAAFATGNILQIIFFTIFLAIMASTIGRDSEALTNAINGIDRIMQNGIMAIMVIAPYAIFMLVTAIFMDLGFAALKALGKYAATVLLGLLIHGFVTLPILVLLMGRYNPYRLFKALSPAMMTAWSTASSAATLPMTMSNLEKRAGVEGRIGNFVLPLGATINMDGTALYESVAVIFIAQIMGIELTIGMQVVIFVTASLAAIGAAAIPGAGLVTMGIVLTAAGLPLDGIGLILAIDRILDQFRTAINVWGDATAAVVIGHSENAIHEV
ncbi:dicarboxylate/amino acid:cation symporter [Desulfosarcina ovata]|uniref:Sodium:dicarboxylate symporter n=1 Tax=Desulfosarcina ovata subsp. ovata TaxID=2752305 RepID=A0A5K8AGA0_9BACT|nr:dicarboxylate/amino acid:cation symporter [Desulfosarcina ovata]BBO91722.1 sodium:dicarboxylate symporter [Desulfosarcina ovata subsp. ovata]